MEIYLDTAATTPIHTIVKDAIYSAFEVFGNPSSLHRKGLEAERLVTHARNRVKAAFQAPDATLVFTGSGTEANNLAILGISEKLASRGRHAITTQIEHPSVLRTFTMLEKQGWDVTYIRPSPLGDVSVEDVISAIRKDTTLVSVMHVNNETGALLPVESIGQALRHHPRIVFHVDGIQAFGKVATSWSTINADMYSVSAHKIGGPKGIGGLFIRKGLSVAPIVHGGGQESGFRSGTENVPYIHGFGVACEQQQTLLHFRHVLELNKLFSQGLETIEGVKLILPKNVSPYIVCATFLGLRGEVLVHALETKQLYSSTGSACSSKSVRVKGHPVLSAMGLSAAEMSGAVRFSFGAWHTCADVEKALDIISTQTTWLRTLS